MKLLKTLTAAADNADDEELATLARRLSDEQLATAVREYEPLKGAVIFAALHAGGAETDEVPEPEPAAKQRQKRPRAKKAAAPKKRNGASKANGSGSVRDKILAELKRAKADGRPASLLSDRSGASAYRTKVVLQELRDEGLVEARGSTSQRRWYATTT